MQQVILKKHSCESRIFDLIKYGQLFRNGERGLLYPFSYKVENLQNQQCVMDPKLPLKPSINKIMHNVLTKLFVACFSSYRDYSFRDAIRLSWSAHPLIFKFYFFVCEVDEYSRQLLIEEKREYNDIIIVSCSFGRNKKASFDAKASTGVEIASRLEATDMIITDDHTIIDIEGFVTVIKKNKHGFF